MGTFVDVAFFKCILPFHPHIKPVKTKPFKKRFSDFRAVIFLNIHLNGNYSGPEICYCMFTKKQIIRKSSCDLNHTLKPSFRGVNSLLTGEL